MLELCKGKGDGMEKVCVCVLWRRVRTWLAAHVIVKPRRLRRPQITCTAIRSSTPHSIHTHIHTHECSITISSPITYPKFRSKIPINKEKKIHMNMSISETDRLTAHTYWHRPDRQTDRTDIQTSTRQIDKQVV